MLSDVKFKCKKTSLIQNLPVCDWTYVIHKYVSCNTLEMEKYSVEDKRQNEF